MQERVFTIPFKAIERPSFWRGVLHSFNLFPTVERHTSGDPYVDDALAMAGDWYAVGQDLENALAKARLEYGQQLDARGVHAEISPLSKSRADKER